MNKHDAIYATASTVVVIRGDDAFDANGDAVVYSEADVQAYIAANAYKELRKAAYPSIVAQLDLIYHGGIDVWKAAITVVKEEFPK
jgi:rhodanese-related sulfurtransferase